MDFLNWRVEDGDEAFSVLKAFELMVKRESVVSVSGNVRVHQTAEGKAIVGEDVISNFDGAFSVSLRGSTDVVIGKGFVNLTMPMIDGVLLDGTTPEGKPHRDGVPVLSIKEGGDSETRRSYICLRVKMLEDFEEGFDPEDEEALTVVHLKTLAPGVEDGPGYPEEGEGIGYKPIAQIEWDETAKLPRSIFQMNYFNQEYEFIKGDEDTKGRHEFAPAP